MVRQFGNDQHTIWHGDALEVLHKVRDQSCGLIFADPPYNIGKNFNSMRDRWPSDSAYLAWCAEWIELCTTKLTPTGSLYLMASTQSMPYLDISVRNRMTVLSRIVWHYDSSGVQARKHFGSLWEPILHCVADPKDYVFNADDITVAARTGAERKLIDYRKAVPAPYSSTKVPGNVWYFPRVRYRMPEYEHHPSQKPEALLARIISASSNEGDLVLDPFAGTFTCSAVAQRLGRQSIGIELDETFVGIGLRRLGLASELDGVPLVPVRKRTARRNPPGRAPGGS